MLRNLRRASSMLAGILLWTGMLHGATVKSPDGRIQFSVDVKEVSDTAGLDFLKSIPTSWTETRAVDGYPGRFVVIARQAGAS